MRIRTKLLVTYLALIGAVSLAGGLGLPTWVDAAIINAEYSRMGRQASTIAGDLAFRIRTRRLVLQPAMALFENILVDDTLVIVDGQGNVMRSSRPELDGRRLDLEAIREEQTHRRHFLPHLSEVPEIGPALVALAPVPVEEAKGISVVVIRDVQYIRNFSRPIVVRMIVTAGLVLLVAVAASAWLSRDMVERLQSTGRAARALAEGDLDQRAPQKGRDEITELAGHFNHMAERIQKLVEGLQRSERVRKELLVTVSHELRTPMTSVAGFAEALRDGVVKDESQRQRYYQIIASEAARLNRLISDVFTVAKLESGQAEIRLQVMEVAPWLEEVAEFYRQVAEGAGSRLELALAPGASQARIYGDRDRLDQIIGNLLNNAIRFSPPGGTITIRAEGAGPDVVVTVADRGPGMSAPEAERVFERFFQGANKGQGHAGAGLGLAIAKSLVEAHGGTVGVQTAPGQGAAFWFRLKQAEG